ncbi:cytochrome P450 CYP82D47-like [Lotus japonicus]|uniref:cytochrome P450 CYP82D47-like n=1 Tax=Lotus japonicus TaxID=34305 RepID=UPI00258B81EE|nr:cytochrome P450 CYP82D47-like [Lotus japonicus]
MGFITLLSQSMEPYTIYATLIFLFCLLFWLLKRSNADIPTKAPPPPEAEGAWPLIGHLHLLGGSHAAHVTLGNMADKYGPIFTLRLGIHRTLVVSNWEMAKECFTVNDKVFASRPNSLAFEVLGSNFSFFGSSPYGPYWRYMRKIATVEVLSTKRIEMLKQVMDSEVKAAMKKSYDFWVMMKESGPKKAVTEMEKWFANITLNVMFRAVLGKRLTGMGCEDDEEENEKIQKAVRDFFHLFGQFTVSDAVPFLRWLDLDGQEKKMKKTAKELDDFAQVWLEQHKYKTNSGSEEWKNGEHDFMDLLLSAVDDECLHGHDHDTIVKSTCLQLILAGTDTMTRTLTWALSLLLNNREVLNKATHELDTQIGGENVVVESDFEKLEYLQAIVKETLRLYPPGPLSVPHESMEDCIVGGYHVPAHMRLLTNISKLQQDPSLYSDPLEFRPERFLTTHKDIDLKGKHFEFIPFGAGRRICPGISFALQLMQMTLAALLHGFEIVTIDGGPVDMVEKTGLTNVKASPLQVILTPRQSIQVYNQN